MDASRPFDVTLACATPGSIIRYTVDGSEPSEVSTGISSGNVIRVGSNLTLKAKAFVSGMTPSPVESGTYHVTGAISGGNAHVVALKSDGSVFSWGARSNGRLGQGTSPASGNQLTPSAVLTSVANPLTDIKGVSAFFNTTVTFDTTGNVWAWGDNSSGQVGDNTLTDSWYARKVLKTNVTYSSAQASDFLSDIVGVSAGYSFSTGLDKTGKVWAWGQRLVGRLGDGYTSTTTASSRKFAGTVKTDGIGTDLTNIVKVSAGQAFTVALQDADHDGRGTIFGWGQNGSGQIGLGFTSAAVGYATAIPNLIDVVDVATGWDHTVIIREDSSGIRTVWCWGSQTNGRLGNGETSVAGISSPTQVYKISDDPTPVVSELRNIVQVAAGPRHSLALDSSGIVWSWGFNVDGELADGTYTQRAYAKPVKMANGLPLGSVNRVVAISAGGHDVGSPYPGFSAAVDSSGIIYGWGYNDNGQAATGTSTANVKFATASAFSTNLRNVPPIVTLGAPPSPHIYPGTFNLMASPNDTDGIIDKVSFFQDGVYLGERHASPWSWSVENVALGLHTFSVEASDNSGGIGVASVTSTIVSPTVSVTRAADANERGILPKKGSFKFKRNNTLAPLVVSYNVGGTATAGGDYVTLPGVLNFAAGVDSVYVDVLPIADSEFEIPETVILQINPSQDYTLGLSQATVTIGNYDLAAGRNHSLLLDDSGHVWAWGANSAGQLGTGQSSFSQVPRVVNSLSSIAMVAAGVQHSLALSTDGNLWAWGDNSAGTFGNGSIDSSSNK
jgi:alpha-tubulin suppressor-like RCC1 family protein